MTTEGFFLSLFVFFFPTPMSLTIHEVDLCLRKEASDGPLAVVWRLGSIRAPPHQPNALRLTEFDASPPCHRSPVPPHTPPLVGSVPRPWQLAQPISRVAARRQRGGDAPRAKRPPHARGARRQRGGDRGAHQAQSGRRGQGERGASAGAAEHTRRHAARALRQRGGDRGAPRARSDSRGPDELPGPLTAEAADGDRRRRCHRRVPGQPAHGSVPAAPSAHPHLRTVPTLELEPNTMQSASAEYISSNVNCQPQECAAIRKINCFVIPGWYSVYVGIFTSRITRLTVQHP